MTRAIDRLEAEGLIVRRADPTDRRSVLLAVTAAGERYCEIFVDASL
ncbi:MarR family transcriptional regulator [Acidisoma cellulosilytica]|uniref:MarR family transcriptional regulator n=1 Tax=Acidisoma cellulosilyticum TaxID=2802395 RepID=A0A963Z7R3_9PROT|nr:MarR family transcriptional regulator [Acidisoma cellulosilyticum]